MLFEIVNDLFENFLISYFISSYLKLEKKNKIFFFSENLILFNWVCYLGFLCQYHQDFLN